MTSFESNSYSVNSEAEQLAAFLSTPANLQEILPEDRIENWKSTEDWCSFKIKGLAAIKLKLKSSSKDSVIYSSEEGPFDFELKVFLEDQGGVSNVRATFDAEVASMMAMMLKSPLTNFLNSLGEALEAKYGSS